MMGKSERIAIAGVPKSGKTTLADEIGQERGEEVWHTDDLMDLPWSEQSQAASEWFGGPGVVIVEGVAVPRALRKWLKRNAEGKPVDRVIFLHEYLVEPSLGQARMGKGCRTIWQEIVGGLEGRGVIVEER